MGAMFPRSPWLRAGNEPQRWATGAQEEAHADSGFVRDTRYHAIVQSFSDFARLVEIVFADHARELAQPEAEESGQCAHFKAGRKIGALARKPQAQAVVHFDKPHRDSPIEESI